MILGKIRYEQKFKTRFRVDRTTLVLKMKILFFVAGAERQRPPPRKLTTTHSYLPRTHSHFESWVNSMARSTGKRRMYYIPIIYYTLCIQWSCCIVTMYLKRWHVVLVAIDGDNNNSNRRCNWTLAEGIAIQVSVYVQWMVTISPSMTRWMKVLHFAYFRLHCALSILSVVGGDGFYHHQAST